jgi:hypothetical protein
VLEIRIDEERASFAPGETVRGSVSWTLAEAPDAVELRLLWYTEGRGDQDVGVARSLRIEAPASVGSSAFELETPAGPYSCSGRLLSIRWALEAVASPGKYTVRSELVVAPDGREVELTRVAAG